MSETVKSETGGKSKGCSGGCLKMFIVLAVLGFIGSLLLAGVGGVVYMNREKWGMDEWFERFEAELKKASEQAGKSSGGRTGGGGKSGSGGGGGAGRSGGSGNTFARPVVSQAPMHVNKASFDQFSQRDDVLVLVDYYADWCGPCKRLAPSLATLAQSHGDKVIVLKVNVDTEKELAQAAGVRSIPDVRLMHGGREVDKFVGLIPYKRIESMILKHASLLPAPSASSKPGGAGGTSGNSGQGSIDPVSKRYMPPGMSRK